MLEGSVSTIARQQGDTLRVTPGNPSIETPFWKTKVMAGISSPDQTRGFGDAGTCSHQASLSSLKVLHTLWCLTCSATQIDLVRGMVDCLYAECKPCITDCVMAELEKLGQKYRVALKVAKVGPRLRSNSGETL